GIGGRAGSPLYAIPVMKNFTAASCSHPGSPAMLADLSAQGIGTVALKGRSVPFSHCSLTGSPFSLCGVWQSRHMPMFSTRYLPRSSFADGVAVCVLASPARTDTIPSATTRKATIFAFTGAPLLILGELAEI